MFLVNRTLSSNLNVNFIFLIISSLHLKQLCLYKILRIETQNYDPVGVQFIHFSVHLFIVFKIITSSVCSRGLP